MQRTQMDPDSVKLRRQFVVEDHFSCCRTLRHMNTAPTPSRTASISPSTTLRSTDASLSGCQRRRDARILSFCVTLFCRTRKEARRNFEMLAGVSCFTSVGPISNGQGISLNVMGPFEESKARHWSSYASHCCITSCSSIWSLISCLIRSVRTWSLLPCISRNTPPELPHNGHQSIEYRREDL